MNLFKSYVKPDLDFLTMLTDQCHVLSDSEAEKIPNPIYNLDPKKFLVPLLPWGPVEQMRGFREALLMAFYLNRYDF